MTRNKPWTAVSKALAAVTVMLIVTLALASGAAASTFKILHTFTWARTPEGNLILDAAGNLYGTTYNGGGHGLGTVFKLKPNPDGLYWRVSILHSFTGTDGANPYGVIFDASGNLYGTTYGGGAYGGGTVFELSPTASGDWTEKILYNFQFGYLCTTGCEPNGIIFDASGNLYGTTYSGGTGAVSGWAGTVFELSPTASGDWTEKILVNFSGSDGSLPMAGLIFDASGNLYSTTFAGGEVPCVVAGFGNGCGTVFKLSPDPDGKWTESVLARFLDMPGVRPYAGLVFDKAGNLYGTTAGDGEKTFGSVFEITP
jgi:uncharacterized repeat protein (TIGR03803 family)